MSELVVIVVSVLLGGLAAAVLGVGLRAVMPHTAPRAIVGGIAALAVIWLSQDMLDAASSSPERQEEKFQALLNQQPVIALLMEQHPEDREPLIEALEEASDSPGDLRAVIDVARILMKHLPDYVMHTSDRAAVQFAAHLAAGVRSLADTPGACAAVGDTGVAMEHWGKLFDPRSTALADVVRDAIGNAQPAPSDAEMEKIYTEVEALAYDDLGVAEQLAGEDACAMFLALYDLARRNLSDRRLGLLVRGLVGQQLALARDEIG
jgi:hypothetical protein